jgi:hypothetical protein
MKKITIILTHLLLVIVGMTSYAASLTPPVCQSSGQDSQTECMYQVDDTTQLYAMTNTPYALCSQAICSRDSEDAELATCICPVYHRQAELANWQKVSVGPHSLTDSPPTYVGDKLTTVMSNFSLANFANFADVKPTRCQFDQPQPWASCFGATCQVRYQTIDGQEVPIAACQCPIKASTQFISLGPTDASQCQTSGNALWAATVMPNAATNKAIIFDMYRRYFTDQVNVPES